MLLAKTSPDTVEVVGSNPIVPTSNINGLALNQIQRQTFFGDTVSPKTKTAAVMDCTASRRRRPGR